MGRKEIFVGIFVILVVLGIAFGIKKAKDAKVKPLDIPASEESQELENRFNLSISDDVEKINLQASSGFEGVGVATRKYSDGVFSHMIIADLPTFETGNYQAWLVKDEKSNILTGILKFAKGGYLLEFSSNIDYSDYKKVEIRLEDKIVLSGSF